MSQTMKLKQARKRKQKKQWEVAEHCGITTRFYQYIESGKSIPSAKMAVKICRYLGVSPLYIDEWASDTESEADKDLDYPEVENEAKRRNSRKTTSVEDPLLTDPPASDKTELDGK